MKIKTYSMLFALGAVLTASAPGLAHHSFAMFAEKEVALKGRVTEFQWTNPHTFVEVDVTDAKGKITHWSVESHSPSILARAGWKRTSLKPGDVITVRLNPLKDGRPGGSLVSVTLPDGRVLTEGVSR